MTTRRVLLGAAALGGVGACATMSRPVKAGDVGPGVGVKCAEFYRRPDGVSAEVHLEHWRRVRQPLLAALPGVTRTALNIVHAVRSPQAIFDGVEQIWFRDMDAFRAAMNGAESHEALAGLIADTPQFMASTSVSQITTEAVIRPLPSSATPTMAKRIGLVGRTPSTDREQFIIEWRDHHAPEVLPQPGLIGYSLNVSERERTPSAPWDGYAELWWTDWDAFDEARRLGSAGYANRASFFYSHQVAYVTEYA